MRSHRHLIRGASVIALAAPMLLAGAPAHASTRFIGFDDFVAECNFSDSFPLRDRYGGVSFRGPTADGGPAIVDKCGNWGIEPKSGDNFLAFGPSLLASGATADGPVTMTFARRQKVVKIWIARGAGGGGASAWSLIGKRDGKVIRKDTEVSSVNEWIALRIENRTGFKRAVLRADIEADGYWLADSLTLRR